MFKTIEGATDCQIRSVIRFLNARHVLPSEIHHQICQTYGDNAMSGGMVRKWVRMFDKGRENVHDEAQSGCPSLMNADLVCKVNERVHDDRRILLVEFLPQGAAVKSTVYCETLKKLRCAIQNKRCGMLRATIILLHNNARPHSAAKTQDLILSFKWEQMDHPLYSPDLAPSDFNLFLHLKKFLGGNRFDDDDLKDAVQKWLTSQAAAFYEEGIQKLEPR